MSRREKLFAIENPESRDNGKVFIITEMSAWEGEKLAEDVFRVMGEKNFTGLPVDVISMGCAGLANYGVAVLSAADADVSATLKTRLLDTVDIEIENNGKTITRKVVPSTDFEEISTIRQLIDEVFSLNFSYFTLGGE